MGWSPRGNTVTNHHALQNWMTYIISVEMPAIIEETANKNMPRREKVGQDSRYK
jgi:hypothetical protein